MKEVIINNQKELDALDLNFKGKISIIGKIDKIDKAYPNSEVHVSGSAQISDVSGSAQITYVSGSAQISDVYGSAQISDVYGSAQITYVSGSAQITYVYGSAQITYVSGSAQIRNVYGSAQILSIDQQATVTTMGKNIVSYFNDKSVNLNASSATTIVILDRFNATWDAYVSMYPVIVKDDVAIMYKAVRKVGNKFFSNHDPKFEYKIGKIIKETCDTDVNTECSHGIHVSHKMWALSFGRTWENMAIIEVEVKVNYIIVPTACDGKVRTDTVKVLREVPKEEWYA